MDSSGEGGRGREWRAAIEDTLHVDRPRLAARWQRLRRGSKGDFERLARDVERSRAKVAARRASVPAVSVPADLPIATHQAEIARLIEANRVVIVCGETGSGKSTQLPKICLGLGRAAHGMIGHTQPRRVAARSVAARIAAETNSELGHQIGYAVRFDDRSRPETLVRVMTDGLLLAELERDRELRRYDTLIIDEAHERSLNVDFLLGYLKRLLPKRPELRVIVTSATIEPERFAAYFADAPILEVAGRQYPVEVRYRPPAEDAQEQGAETCIGDAIAELLSGDRRRDGDFLVFLPGEREIRETAARLRRRFGERLDVLPLYARLSAAEQGKVFKPGPLRRIVLATNVAETSLTVPRIRYVIDTGLARISRYSYRSKIQRLPIEAISRSAADQRKGRCGRIGPGICVRLYSEEDFEARPLHTDAEIRRTNLASVILQMEAYRLGRIERFPFLDPPDRRFVKDGYRLLRELEAVDDEQHVTPLGRQLARFPIDPRLARMLVAAQRHGALRELLIIAAALSIQDPRERPADKAAAADAAHAQFADPQSDFAALLNLWRVFREQAHSGSRSALRRWCRDHFLSYPRMLEWRDLRRQLAEISHELGLRADRAPASAEPIHRAVLTGLLSHIGEKQPDGDYRGPRGVRLRIFPGSGLRKRAPAWIAAASLIETARTYAHTVAAVEPAWIEAAAVHLVQRHYDEPHWQPARGRVAALERVTLYGLTLAAGRRVDFARIAPTEARRIFIEAALVGEQCRTTADFFLHNRALRRDVERLEAKLRRPALQIDMSELRDFYDARLPAAVVDQQSLEGWLAAAGGPAERSLQLSRADLLRAGAELPDPADYPDTLELAGNRLKLSYHFEPGADEDGVTLHLPRPLLGQIEPAAVEWLVPGWLAEKFAAVLRGLPKQWRRRFVPVPDTVARCVVELGAADGDLFARMAHVLTRAAGTAIDARVLRGVELPAHLRMRIQLETPAGEPLAAGRDLAVLRAAATDRDAPLTKLDAGTAWQRDGLRGWDFGELPARIEIERSGLKLELYPALADRATSVSLVLTEDRDVAEARTRRGILRLLRLRFAAQDRDLRQRVTRDAPLGLLYRSVGPLSDLAEDIAATAFERCLLAEDPLPRDRSAFEAHFERRSGLLPVFDRLLDLSRRILELHQQLQTALGRIDKPAWHAARKDIASQLERLVYPGFVAATPAEWLGELPRYLQGAVTRLDKLTAGDPRDADLAARIAPHWQRVRQRPPQDADADWRHYRWMVEELRVSLFAQPLGTKLKVSEKKLEEQFRRCA